jgi:hypothetical protein
MISLMFKKHPSIEWMENELEGARAKRGKPSKERDATR